ncbi:hypothetical protein N9W17_01370 [Jannaschia sp.]|nr:hypothetical protein [Jannaschia sp.]
MAPPRSDAPDPEGTADGTRQSPWLTVETALTRVDPGDRLLMMPGRYGAIEISDVQFDGRPLILVPEMANTVTATAIRVLGARNIVIRGIQVTQTGVDGAAPLIETDADAAQIRFERMELRGAPDAEDYRSWDRSEWASGRRPIGAVLRGEGDALIASRLTAVATGLVASGRGADIRGNLIRGFSSDGLQILAPGAQVVANRVEDCIDTGARTAGIRARAPARETLDGLAVEGNIVLEWTVRTHPLRCALTGIALVGGVYGDVSVRNNLVIVSALDGIVANGTVLGVIANNTVVSPGGQPGEHPRIALRAEATDGATVANNIAMSYGGLPDAQRRNIAARYPARLFRDIVRGDFRPKAGSGLIDTADPGAAPSHDIGGIARGQTPDFGAFEAIAQ